MARPNVEIDERIFENLCGIQCTLSEISASFGCSEDTIERWCVRTYGRSFAEVFKEKRGKGRVSLRRSQFKLAEKSAAMSIWLGKQILGQRDNPHDESELVSPGMYEDNEILRGMFNAK